MEDWKNIYRRILMLICCIYVETCGYNNQSRNERVCACCTIQCIENEYHFTLICPAYRQLILKYLPRYYCSCPNMYKFLSFMKNNRKSVIYKLVCFLRDSWNLRNFILKDK